MPRIPDDFLDCAVYVYASRENAEDGVHAGASGFLIGVQLKNHVDVWQLYVVTNRHVIDKPPRGGARPKRFLRLNRKNAGVEIFEAAWEQWSFHLEGDDLAVLPIELPTEELSFSFVGVQHCLTPSEMNAYNMGPGDDVFMVGRFISHEGKQKNTPTVRFGSIAMMPLEKLRDEETGNEQEAFLVECRSIPGYSGSPVFLYRGEMVRTGPGFVSTPRQVPWLLGVDFCHINNIERLLDADGNPFGTGVHVQSNTGMAGVIPSWRLFELLNCEKLKAQRDKDDEEFTRQRGGRKQTWV